MIAAVSSKSLKICIMGTCNFSKVNASRYYVVEDDGRDWHEIVEDLQESAKYRQDGRRFLAVNERETGWRWHRDAGTVVLEYRGEDVFLAPDYCLNLIGKIILRPGYYQDATLDWDFDAVGVGDNFKMNEYDALDDLAGEVMQDWDHYVDSWNAGIKAMQRQKVRKKLDAALEAMAETLEGICGYLVGENVYQRGGVFSDGTCIYHKVTTDRRRLYAATA